MLPFINEQYEDKISKEPDYDNLVKKYEKLKDIDLEKILTSKGFRSSAKRAAQKILEKRKTTHNKT
jgi:hypothetical protein